MAAARKWQAIEGATPSARRQHLLLAHPSSQRLLLLGGRSDSAVLADLASFDLGASLAWTTAAAAHGSAPRKRAAAGGAVLGDVLFVYGGDAATPHPLGDLHMLHLGSGGGGGGEPDAWERVKGAGAPPFGRYGHSLSPLAPRSAPGIGVQGGLLVHGGFGKGHQLNDTWTFDLASRTWTEIKTKGRRPPARSNHAAVVWKGALWIVMGAGGRTFYDDIWRLDLAEGVWEEMEVDGADAPSPRSSMAYCSQASSLVIHGGNEGLSVGGRGAGKLQDLWILSLATLRWELVTPAFKTVRFPSGIKEYRPSVRDGHKAVLYGGDLLLFGGAGSGGASDVLGDFWVVSLDGLLDEDVEEFVVLDEPQPAAAETEAEVDAAVHEDVPVPEPEPEVVTAPVAAPAAAEPEPEQPAAVGTLRVTSYPESRKVESLVVALDARFKLADRERGKGERALGKRLDALHGQVDAQGAAIDQLRGAVVNVERKASEAASQSAQSEDERFRNLVLTRLNALEACITAQQEAIVHMEVLFEQEREERIAEREELLQLLTGGRAANGSSSGGSGAPASPARRNGAGGGVAGPRDVVVVSPRASQGQPKRPWRANALN